MTAGAPDRCGPRRTPRLERWVHHLAAAAVGLSGMAYGFMKYLMEPDPDSFSVVSHPFQPHALHVHVLSAPVLVLAFGLLLRDHAVERAGNRGWTRARRSGLFVLFVLVPMTASGYLLQTATSQSWLRALAWIHGLSGLAFLGGAAGHLLAARLRPGAGRDPQGGEVPAPGRRRRAGWTSS